ncbi:MAG: hypothetical protein M1817_004675 [Caeruleum heppii]|nr:MAG: hypothetical protein M1817_004675 [Caeruleum heppii]
MPAPLAKGLIIAASVLVAAGIAVYENPNVRDWIEKNRQRFAERWYPADTPQPDRQASPEAKKRQHAREEAERTAAVDAARKKREEMMRVNGEEFMRRHSSRKNAGEDATTKKSLGPDSARDRHTSFDDFLQNDGSGAYTLHTSGVEVNDQVVRQEGEGLRQRTDRHGLEGLKLGAATANPFADDDGGSMDVEDTPSSSLPKDRELERSHQQDNSTFQTPVSPPSEEDQLTIHTPTTSASESTPSPLSTPLASPHQQLDLPEHRTQAVLHSSSPPLHHLSTSPSVMSLQSDSTATLDDDVSLVTASEGEGDILEEVDSEVEVGGVGTPMGSWSEIGSVRSGRSRRSSWGGSSSGSG